MSLRKIKGEGLPLYRLSLKLHGLAVNEQLLHPDYLQPSGIVT